MLDMAHLVGQSYADIQTFIGDSANATTHWKTWTKPRGKSMCHILLIGKGGNGGVGVIGAASTAAGGGGGGSGGQTSLIMPLHMLPDTLFLSLAGANPSTTAISSYVAIAPLTTASNVLAVANGGGAGGNGSAGTAGAAGAAGGNASIATMPLGWMTGPIILAGQAGGLGGTSSVNPAAVVIPVTGLRVTGGTGGGGLAAAGSAGAQGAGITGGGAFPTMFNPLSSGVATDPPFDGAGGIKPVPGLLYGYGGLGGNATNGSATGAGLRQASGGNGAPGCGGGGSGGALTGSTPGVIGLGGPALCIITCW